MKSVIKKGASKEEIIKLFKRLAKNRSKRKAFDAYKFCGVIKFDDEALSIQKKMRDEWA